MPTNGTIKDILVKKRVQVDSDDLFVMEWGAPIY